MRFKFVLYDHNEEIENKTVEFQADTMSKAFDHGIMLFRKGEYDKKFFTSHVVKAQSVNLDDVYKMFYHYDIVVLTPKIFSSIEKLFVDSCSSLVMLVENMPSFACDTECGRCVLYLNKLPENGYCGFIGWRNSDNEPAGKYTKIFVRKAESEFYSDMGYFIKDNEFKIKEFFFEG